MNSAWPAFHLGYRPSLDGLRGIAILMVLVDHGQILGFGCFGFIGVNTFFVLSGFLITCLLVAEYDQTRTIGFGRFYLRRALRLLPALVVMLAVYVGFSFWMDSHHKAVREMYEALVALFYFSNWAGIYHWGRLLSLLHTWSLSVEEQFYILWPGMLWFLLTRTRRSSLLCWILLGAFLSAMWRMSLFVGDTSNIAGNVYAVDPARLFAGTDTRADSLLLGSFAGALMASGLLPRGDFFRRALKTAALIFAPGLLGLGIFWGMSPAMICLGWLFASVMAMTVILYLVTSAGSGLHWVLQNPVLVYVGRISYGLYVWHYPILIAMQQHQMQTQNMLYLLVVVPVALLSYYLIERPCLRWKRRFQVVESATV